MFVPFKRRTFELITELIIKIMYLIKIGTHNNHGCWLRSFYDGDPDRTLVRDSALKFAKKATAKSKVKLLSEKYPNRRFELEQF